MENTNQSFSPRDTTCTLRPKIEGAPTEEGSPVQGLQAVVHHAAIDGDMPGSNDSWVCRNTEYQIITNPRADT